MRADQVDGGRRVPRQILYPRKKENRKTNTVFSPEHLGTTLQLNQKSSEQAEGDGRDGEEIHGRDGFPMVTKKGEQRLAGSGFLWVRFIQREIVLSETSKPSMRSSPWMRGAPQVGFSVTIWKIRSRTSLETHFLPLARPTLEIAFQ